MLKSTHFEPPLPPDWTEHRAPTGHKYYYNSATQKSTYTRPTTEPAPQWRQGSPHIPNNTSIGGYYNSNNSSSGAPNFSNSAYPSYLAPFASGASFDGSQPIHYRPETSFNRTQNTRRFHDNRQSAKDRPRTKHDIPGCAPWVLVKTKLGRRFVHNPDTGESFWKIPKDVIGGVVEFDIQERKRHEKEAAGETAASDDGDKEGVSARSKDEQVKDEGAESEEYDEVEIEEVTDSEYEDDGTEQGEEGPAAAKRRRTDEDQDARAAQDPTDQNIEFGEDDMAWQLEQMGEYEAEEGDDDHDNAAGFYGEDEEDDQYNYDNDDDKYNDEAARAAFKDLLSDYQIDPYSSWETVVEGGKLVDDERYVLLRNMRTRNAVFLEWSSARIQAAKQARAAQTKRDPRVAYLALLHAHATPKLFWPEFKRKYKREPALKDAKLADKDREKLYREHINRLTKRTDAQRRQDLSELLQSAARTSSLRLDTDAAGGAAAPATKANANIPFEEVEKILPDAILADLRYISLPAAARDPIVRNHIANLLLPPSLDTFNKEAEKEEEEQGKDAAAAATAALRKRDAEVSHARKQQELQRRHGKARLRDEEAELQRATRAVGKDGLLKSLQ